MNISARSMVSSYCLMQWCSMWAQSSPGSILCVVGASLWFTRFGGRFRFPGRAISAGFNIFKCWIDSKKQSLLLWKQSIWCTFDYIVRNINKGYKHISDWWRINQTTIAGLHNKRPAGHMKPARYFLAARENPVAENVAKARLRIITCTFRISSLYHEIDFCGPRWVYVDQFGPSSFLSCAGLYYSMVLWNASLHQLSKTTEMELSIAVLKKITRQRSSIGVHGEPYGPPKNVWNSPLQKGSQGCIRNLSH